MWIFAAGVWAAITVGATWLARQTDPDRSLALGLVGTLIWQGAVHAAWAPVVAAVRLLMRRYGTGAIGLLAFYQAGVAIVPLEALAASLIDGVLAPSPSILAARVLARLPLSVLLYAAIVAFGLSAVSYRRAREEEARALTLAAALAQAREVAAQTALATPERPGRRLMVIVGSRRVPVALEEVEWFGAVDNHVVVHWAGREGVLRATLQSLEGWLDPRVFARCHRLTLVNLARVRDTHAAAEGFWRLTLESGAEVVTSRSYREEALERSRAQVATAETEPQAASMSSE